jgi:hypothetical protein
MSYSQEEVDRMVAHKLTVLRAEPKMKPYIIRFVGRIWLQDTGMSRVVQWIIHPIRGPQNREMKVYSVGVEGQKPHFYGTYHDCQCEAEWKAGYFSTTVIYHMP